MSESWECKQARQYLSSYLDNAVGMKQQRRISAHLGECQACREELNSLQRTQSLLSSVGHRLAPPDLALRLHLAISQQRARNWRSELRGSMVRLENSLHAFMFPATAGVLSAIIVFGVIIGFIPPPSLASSGNDVPVMWFTPPRLESSPFYNSFISTDGLLVVEADVDENGRVRDFRILSGSLDSPALRRQLNNMMIFTTFRPATAFGRPAPGKVVLSFSKVSVRG